jgi:hypothetical protein
VEVYDTYETICEHITDRRTGYLNGAGAQEENLFRRSNYFHSLEDPEQLDSARSWYYPLPEFSGYALPIYRYIYGWVEALTELD